MLDKKKIQNDILIKLSDKLSNLGFDKKIRGQSFWQPFDGGRAMIHVSFIEHDLDFDVTISVSLRIDAIEGMINQSNKLLSKREKEKTSSIGCELGNLSTEFQKRYTITHETNIDETVDIMLESIKITALPFITKYKNIDTLFLTMLKDDESVWLLVPIHYRRAQIAVALAKLMNNEQLEDIIQAKRKFLESRKDYGLNLFDEFVEALK